MSIAMPPSSTETPHRSTGTSVALVDDDPQILEALAVWLQTMGMTPCRFESAEDLLAALKAPQSALSRDLAGAVLDINLKQMHGLELAHELRNLFPRLPLVMISALNVDEIAQLGTLPAKAACLRKPFDLEALEDALFGWIH